MENFKTRTLNLCKLADDTLASLAEKDVSQTIWEALNAYRLQRSSIHSVSDSASIESMQAFSSFCHMVKYLAQVLGSYIPTDKLEFLNSIADKLLADINEQPIRLGKDLLPSLNLLSEDDSISGTLDFIKAEYEQRDAVQKKAIEENLQRIVSIEARLKDIDKNADEKLGAVEKLHSDSLDYLSGKKDQINDLLGLAANSTVGGGFNDVAEKEKKAAEVLRWGAIGCMVASIMLAVNAFLSHADGDWGSLLFKASLVFLISVPAAYFARESAKHRFKYYEFKRLAMELKAFDPYLASLDDADKNRLKVEMAGRFFSSSQDAGSESESYPINVQEVLMELIRRVDKKQ